MEKRPVSIQGDTIVQKTGCGKIYVTVNTYDGEVFEVFLKLGKSGGCAAAQNEAIGRLLSWGCRSGAKIEDAIKSLKGITCTESDKHYDDQSLTYACPHAAAVAIEMALNTMHSKHTPSSAECREVDENKV